MMRSVLLAVLLLATALLAAPPASARRAHGAHASGVVKMHAMHARPAHRPG